MAAQDIEIEGVKVYDVARPSNRAGLPVVSLDEAHAPNKVLAHPDLVRKFATGENLRILPL